MVDGGFDMELVPTTVDVFGFEICAMAHGVEEDVLVEIVSRFRRFQGPLLERLRVAEEDLLRKRANSVASLGKEAGLDSKKEAKGEVLEKKKDNLKEDLHGNGKKVDGKKEETDGKKANLKTDKKEEEKTCDKNEEQKQRDGPKEPVDHTEGGHHQNVAKMNKKKSKKKKNKGDVGQENGNGAEVLDKNKDNLKEDLYGNGKKDKEEEIDGKKANLVTDKKEEERDVNSSDKNEELKRRDGPQVPVDYTEGRKEESQHQNFATKNKKISKKKKNKGEENGKGAGVNGQVIFIYVQMVFYIAILSAFVYYFTPKYKLNRL